MDTSKLSGAQKIVFPTVMELAENGHLVLAYKTLFLATRTDLLVLRRERARRRYVRKIENSMAKLDRLEAQACEVLQHDHSK